MVEPVDLTVWTGVRLGAGFAIGVAFVTLVVSLIVAASVGTGSSGRGL
jgi:hypothetical protein